MVFSVTAIREQDGCFYSPQCPLCSQLSVDWQHFPSLKITFFIWKETPWNVSNSKFLWLLSLWMIFLSLISFSLLWKFSSLNLYYFITIIFEQRLLFFFFSPCPEGKMWLPRSRLSPWNGDDRFWTCPDSPTSPNAPSSFSLHPLSSRPVSFFSGKEKCCSLEAGGFTHLFHWIVKNKARIRQYKGRGELLDAGCLSPTSSSQILAQLSSCSLWLWCPTVCRWHFSSIPSACTDVPWPFSVLLSYTVCVC